MVRHDVVIAVGLLICLGLFGGAARARAGTDETPASAPPPRLSDLDVWNDGLCEVSFYRAVDRIYGQSRPYTRVQLVNRQWMSGRNGVKCEPGDPHAIPVFKLNIAEEIPTNNYNYRYLTTAFLVRPNLVPFKLAVSSQEWCGSTFKHVRWTSGQAHVQCFSYLPGEGNTSWTIDENAIPHDALPLIARDVAAAGVPRRIRLLVSLRSNRQVEPVVYDATLTPGPAESAKVESGTYSARRVDVTWDGPPTGFLVEAKPPYRLLRFRHGPLRGELIHVERRAFWDPDNKSGFHEPGKAP